MKKKVRLISLLCWLLSLGVFALIIVWSNKFPQNDLGDFIGSDILFGIVSFTILALASAKTKKEIEEDKNYKPIKIKMNNKTALILLFILVLVGIGLFVPKVYANYELKRAEQFKNAGLYDDAIKSLINAKTAMSIVLPEEYEILKIEDSISTVQKVKEAALNPQPSPTSKTQPINRNYVQPTIDPDPPVHCQIHERCGGGTKPLKKSECERSICCFLKDGTAKLLSSKSACDNYYSGSNGSSTTLPNNTSTGSTKVSCKFSGSGYSFDFGELTYDECKIKTDAYWASQNTTVQVVPQVVNNAEMRDKCVGDAQRTYQSAITSLNNASRALGGSTSAYDSKVNSLKQQLESDVQYCKDRYP